MNNLKLFDVDFDGCVTYYVAALEADACKNLIATTTGDDTEDVTEVTVTEISLDAAQSIRIRDDDSATRRPLSELFAECKHPSVIACSEW